MPKAYSISLLRGSEETAMKEFAFTMVNKLEKLLYSGINNEI